MKQFRDQYLRIPESIFILINNKKKKKYCF